MSTSLYVHIPFCARACPYCDFDFEVDRSPVWGPFIAGLEREWSSRAPQPPAALDTVYIGGGTPSVLGPAGLAAVSAWIRRSFAIRSVREWSVELNPEHVDPPLLDALERSGTTRVSLGVQSLAAAGLRQLGRRHDPPTAIAAVRAAVERGFSVSCDLIVGWPGQSVFGLCDELRALVGLGVRHLSIYALTIEPDTMWPKLVQKGQRELPDADRQADCLQAVERELTRAGLEHYEVASYARSKADRSQHNLRYWSWSDYIGLGPSAASATFGRDGTVTRRTNVRGLAKWIARPEQADVETLGAERAAAEGLWLGLRRLDGFRIEDFLARFTAVDRRWVENRVADQLARGNLEWVRTDRLRVTPQRWLFHDEICAALL